MCVQGGNSEDLPELDGINQWPLSNTTNQRKEIVLEIDELENLSGILTNRYKLINGTIFQGIYDQNSGDSGRQPENPPYNTTAILNSVVNRKSLNEILEIRKRLDLSGCNGRNFTQLHCDGFCLFDLFEDPCETTNIAREEFVVFEELKGRLGEFWKMVVPHTIGEPEEKADPKLYNNTWVTWRDN